MPVTALSSTRPTSLWPDKALHRHDVAGSYDDLRGVKGVELYSARVLGCTRPGDVVQLDPQLKDEFPWILAHLRRVGLTPTDQVEWSLDPEVARRYPHHASSVFLFSDTDHALWPDAVRLEATRQFNDKNWFLRWCRRHGFPTPTTRFYTAGTSPKRPWWHRRATYYVKGAVSASGQQVIKCLAWSDVVAAVSQMDGDYQVQVALAPDAWLNVQYHFEPDGSATHLATTKQVLEGNVHAGNRYPSQADPRHITDDVARLAAEAGLSGVIAFDVPAQVRFGRLGRRLVAYAQRTNRAWLTRRLTKFWLLECNPRPNGSTYFTIPANCLGAREWIGKNITTRHTSLAAIDWPALRELEFSAGRGTGVVIINWGPILQGKLGVLFIGDPDEQARLEARLSAILN